MSGVMLCLRFLYPELARIDGQLKVAYINSTLHFQLDSHSISIHSYSRQHYLSSRMPCVNIWVFSADNEHCHVQSSMTPRVFKLGTVTGERKRISGNINDNQGVSHELKR